MLAGMATVASRIPTRPSTPQFAPGERFLTVGVVADYFGVTEVTIKNWVDAGQLLAARTVGGHRRIAASSVVKLLEEQGRPVPAALARRKPLVVVLEADPTLSKGLKRALSTKSRVEIAADPYAGLLLVARLKPEIVVVDVHLKDGDARKLLGALRTDPQTKPIDVVAVGSTPADAKAVSALIPASPPPRGAGSLAYVRKPDAIDAVVQRIERPHPTSRSRRR